MELTAKAVQFLEYAISILDQHCQYDDENGSAEADARDGLRLVLIEAKKGKQ